MRKAKEVTIYDIGKKLNVSPAAISFGLQNHPYISSEDMTKIAAGNLINHLIGISNTNTIVVRSDVHIRKSSLKNPG